MLETAEHLEEQEESKMTTQKSGESEKDKYNEAYKHKFQLEGNHFPTKELWFVSDDELAWYMVLPTDWKIFGSAPYVRRMPPYSVKNQGNVDPIQVLGVFNWCWMWPSEAASYICNNVNCGSKATHLKSNRLGHTFFYDIDECLYSNSYLREVLLPIMDKHEVGHVIVTSTEFGYHLWSMEIRANKIDWFPFFRDCQKAFPSDYEFLSDWILRIGNKSNKAAPHFAMAITNLKDDGRPISAGHIAILCHYAKLPQNIAHLLAKDNKEENTYVQLVNYQSWSY